MSDHDDDLRTRVRDLEEALLRQDAAHRADMNLLVEQIFAFLAVNAALAGSLSSRGLLDLEETRTTTLANLPEQHHSANVVAVINSMLKLQPAEPPAPAEATEESARNRFRVIEGGGQSTEEPES